MHSRDLPYIDGRNQPGAQNKRQLEWLHGRIRQAPPQTLVVPS
jgi:hypothetical protein